MFNFMRAAAKNMIDQSIGSGFADKVEDYTRFSANTSIYTTFWTQVQKMYNVVKPYGYAAITTFFLIYLLNAASADQVTVDSLIKVTIQLIIVIAVIKNLETVVNTMLSLSDTFISKMGTINSTGNTEISGQKIVDAWKDSGESDLSMMLQSFVIWLLSKLAHLGIIFAALSRVLQIGIQIIVSPLAVANCFDGGANSKGFQNLKALGGLMLSGFAVYLVAVVGNSFATSLIVGSNNANVGGLWSCVAMQFATAGVAIGISREMKTLF